MGIMADRLNSMVIRVSSPDGQIEGVLRDRDAVSVTFRGDTYRHYQERTLEYQMSRLATLLWTGYQRNYNAAISEVMGYPVKEERHLWDANRRRFRDEQSRTVAEGMSPGKCVYIQNTGMLSWQFVIRDGTLTEIDDQEFAAECLAAFHSLMADYRVKMARLRAEHYGVNYTRKQPRLPDPERIPLVLRRQRSRPAAGRFAEGSRHHRPGRAVPGPSSPYWS